MDFRHRYQENWEKTTTRCKQITFVHVWKGSPWSIKKILCCSLFLWLSCCIGSCSGFAAEMVERSSMCWTTLSTESVIMNFLMVAESESRNRNVKLEITRNADGTVLEPKSEEGDYYTYEIPATTSTSDDSYPYTAKLVVTPSSALPDLQYVMDFHEGGEFSEEFYNIGCDKRRAIGRHNDDGTQFKITKSPIHRDNSNEYVELRAGWATEHEAVTLVKSIRFYFGKSKLQTNNNNNNQMIGTIKKKGASKIRTEEQKQDPQNELKGEIDPKKLHALKAMEGMKQYMPHSHMTRDEIIRNQMGETNDSKAKRQVPDSSPTRKFRQKYDHTEFGKGSLTMTQYLRALTFLVLSVGGFIMWASNQSHRSMKGRRNL